MLKKLLIGTGIASVLTAVFFLGSLSLGSVFAQTSHNATAQSTIQRSNDGSAEVNDADVDQVDEQEGDQNEVDDVTALQGQATITAAEAETVALAANPGATVVKTELDNENGVLVYSVELKANSKVYDVKVDANSGKIVRTEADEPEGQNNDVSEQNGQEADGD